MNDFLFARRDLLKLSGMGLVDNVSSYNTGSRISSIISGIPDYAIQDVKPSY